MIFLNKYFLNFFIAAKKQFDQKKQLILRLCIFLLILTIFSNIFERVNAGSERLWYVAVTQLIVGSNSSISYHISNEILSSRFMYNTIRPYQYVIFKLFESIGTLSVKAFSISILLVTFMSLYQGYVPFNIKKFFISAFIIFLCNCLFNLILIAIGLSAFWLREVRGLIYVNMTATFCFGGLIMPIQYYSDTFKKIAYCTPYPWILSWPADFVSQNGKDWMEGLYYWSLWFTIILLGTICFYKIIINSIKKY